MNYFFCRDIKNQVPSGFGYGVPMALMACGPPMPLMAGGPPMPLMACGAPMAMPQMMCLRSAQLCSGFSSVKKAAFYANDDLDCVSTEEADLQCDEMEASDEMDADDNEEVQDDVVGIEWSSYDGANVSKKVEEDKLTTLIDLQSSDGHFRWDDAVAGYLGSTKAELMSKRADAAISDDIWITAVLIAMLESMAEDKDLWELVVLKAKKFLAKTMAKDQMEKLLTAAAGILKSP